MKIIIFLKNGHRMEIPISDPDNFNLVFMMKSVRSDGCLLGPSVYIDADSIAAVAVEGAAVMSEAPTNYTKGSLQ